MRGVSKWEGRDSFSTRIKQRQTWRDYRPAESEEREKGLKVGGDQQQSESNFVKKSKKEKVQAHRKLYRQTLRRREEFQQKTAFKKVRMCRKSLLVDFLSTWQAQRKRRVFQSMDAWTEIHFLYTHSCTMLAVIGQLQLDWRWQQGRERKTSSLLASEWNERSRKEESALSNFLTPKPPIEFWNFNPTKKDWQNFS